MLRKMIRNIILIIAFTFITIFVVAERPDHDEYNERTSFLISKIQIITDANRIEALKYAYDQEIKDFCLENNYNEEEIRDVLDR